MDRLTAAYKRLGIRRGAALTEVTRAYRVLAKRHHPDFNPQDQQSSHQIMMEINEAYEIIKESLKQARYDAYDRAFQTVNNPGSWSMDEEATGRFWNMAEMVAEMNRQAEEERRAAEEKLKREREALNRYWKRVLKEQETEESEGKTLQVIIENTSILVSYFYQQGLHNPMFRMRPYGKLLFSKYSQKYREFMKKCKRSAQSFSSTTYQDRGQRVLAFLRSFHEAVHDIDHSGLEQRASAAYQFDRAFRSSDRMVDGLFTDENMSREDERKLLRETLNLFDEFITNYPDSLLLPRAQGRVRLLEDLYRAFMED